jgi:hypothetical protein
MFTSQFYFFCTLSSMSGLSLPPQNKPSNWRGEIRVSKALAYYRITKTETNFTAYRDQRIENLWRGSVMLTLQHTDCPAMLTLQHTDCPAMLTLQHTDCPIQRRVILRSNFLSPAMLERVSYEVGNRLNIDNVTTPTVM